MENYTKEQLWKAILTYEAYLARKYIEDAPHFCDNCANVSVSTMSCDDGQESQCNYCFNPKCWVCKVCNVVYCNDCGESIKGVCEKCRDEN